ncbi:MAG: hypothetical protein ACOY4K_05595 [Pseudomonadota bacterium]
MRHLAACFAVAAGLGLASVAAAEETAAPPAPAKPAKPAKDDPNRMVCTREHVVGSNRPKKVCMTVAQRDALRDQARRSMDEGRRTAGGDELAQDGM